jgi:hypothetical protein
MIVYHYFSELHGLDALQHSWLKVGRLFDLNDPADCRPLLRNMPAGESITADEYFKFLYQEAGILCFCDSIDDPVVWSHYADSHRGIAIGYDIQRPLHKVNYLDDRPTVDCTEASKLLGEHGTVTTAFLEEVIARGFTTKAKSWGYESERRVFIGLSRGTVEMVGSLYFYKTDPLVRMKSVILGYRCRLNESDILMAARNYAHRGDRSWVYRARLRDDKFNLDIYNQAQKKSLEIPKLPQQP